MEAVLTLIILIKLRNYRLGLVKPGHFQLTFTFQSDVNGQTCSLCELRESTRQQTDNTGQHNADCMKGEANLSAFGPLADRKRCHVLPALACTQQAHALLPDALLE